MFNILADPNFYYSFHGLYFLKYINLRMYLHVCNALRHYNCTHCLNNTLMKGKALRKHSLHEKTAASVLLKLFISGNE